MESSKVICPLCRDAIDRLVYRFHFHSEQVIVDRIKLQHPHWTQADGICSRCIDYFHTEILLARQALPEVGPYFPIKSADDFLILPTPLRLEADARFKGKGVTICLIDSGFFPHPDLTVMHNRVRKFIDVTNDQGNDSDEALESMWHGTMTSVVCAGDGYMSNGLYRGIASESDLVFVKVQDRERKISSSNLAKALEWVLKHHKEHNIRIVNISVGGDEDSITKNREIAQLAQQLIAEGIVIVAAVGNTTTGYLKAPANLPGVISVGGVNDGNVLSPGAPSMYHFTYGVTADGLMKPELLAHAIWIAAPILPNTQLHRDSIALHQLLAQLDEQPADCAVDSELRNYIDESLLKNAKCGDIRDALKKRIQGAKFISPHYMHVDGTSFAAPIVSSIVAQLLQVNPGLTPPDIREILFSTAHRLERLPVEQQGYGLAQPRNAIIKALRTINVSTGNISPKIDQQKRTITFFLQHDSASHISLSGSFNEWSREVFPMQAGLHGIWKIEIPLLPQGKYYYKFLIDDELWVEDVLNPYQEPDGFNGLNSVLHIQSN